MAGRFKHTANKIVNDAFKKKSKNLNVNIEEFSEFVSILLESSVQEYEDAGRKAMKDIRCMAMCTWLSTKNSGRYIAYERAIKFDKTLVDQNIDGKKINITIRSYVDISTFDSVFANSSSAYDNMKRWNDKHKMSGWIGKNYITGETFVGNAIDIPYEPGEYSLFNMWTFGHSALPQKATFTGTNWINERYTIREPLQWYTEKNMNKKWNKTVTNYYNNKSK